MAVTTTSRIINDGVLVLTDLGADAYVKDTFGPKRYTSEVINSFGHPVPRVAGRLQLTGANAKAVTVRTDFTEDRDVWEQDITSAYDAPGLLSLTRTFIFTRTGGGKLEVVDHVKFDRPQSFGTAIILRPGQSRKSTGENRFQVSADGKTVEVALATDSTSALMMKEDPIIGIVPSSGSHGTRVGIDLAEPVTEATIRMTITPVP